jgi:hypothetical protein
VAGRFPLAKRIRLVNKAPCGRCGSMCRDGFSQIGKNVPWCDKCKKEVGEKHVGIFMQKMVDHYSNKRKGR